MNIEQVDIAQIVVDKCYSAEDISMFFRLKDTIVDSCNACYDTTNKSVITIVMLLKVVNRVWRCLASSTSYLYNFTKLQTLSL